MSRDLVFGDAIFVEPAQPLSGLEDHHVMPPERQPMRAGKAGRPTADDGDFLSASRATPEWVWLCGQDRVGRVALEPADLDGLALLRHAHAGLLAQYLRRADARAGTAEDVGLEDAPSRSLHIVRRDLLDEAGNVDARGTCFDAGCVIAEIATICLNQRGLALQGRMDVAEIRTIGLGIEPHGRDVRAARRCARFRHGLAVPLLSGKLRSCCDSIRNLTD